MEGIKTIFPDCETLLFPIADGGEGMLDILTSATKGKYRTLPAHGPLMELVQGRYGISGDGQTALIEMAAVSGLPLVPEDKRNPMLTTTYGTGELILDALEQGCRHFIVGIGGSATNDGGCGCAAALGVKFTRADGSSFIPVGGNLDQIAGIGLQEAQQFLRNVSLSAMCDIDNPLYGPTGAAYVFAPQKGADEQMTAFLDQQLIALSHTIETQLGCSVAAIPGAGAAGGFGAGMVAFLGAELQPGIEAVLELVNFDSLLADCDMVFTGAFRAMVCGS